jgi:hypothetical protein
MSRMRAGDLVMGAARIRREAAANDIVRNGDPLSKGDCRHADEVEARALATPPEVLTQIGFGNEFVPVAANGYSAPELVNTIEHPSYVTVEASRDRLELAHRAGVLETALDLSETIGAKNSIEKMLAAQMALLHKATMKVGTRLTDAADRLDGVIDQRARDNLTNQVVRLANAFGRATAEYQAAALTWQKLRSGGQQLVTVQHVTVKDGGQAVVAGHVKGGGKEPK